jgi:hypothetical protein
MREHLETWGWVSLLKELAKTKVFDMPGTGLNSVDCVRISPAFDVLLYASEEKLSAEAESLDFERSIKSKTK